MLIQFSVRNYRTFREKATLSMVASGYDKKIREVDNIIPIPEFDLRLLKSAVIYGANASGKTKFLEAIDFMKKLVRNSYSDALQKSGEAIPIEPHLLNVASAESSSEFEVLFIYGGTRYRYGFEIDKKQVVAEWLYHQPRTKEVEIFYRDYQNFEYHKRISGFRIARSRIKEGSVRENVLLLSQAAHDNDDLPRHVAEWFNRIGPLSGVNEDSFLGGTLGLIHREKKKSAILDFLLRADFGIEDIQLTAKQVHEIMDDEQLKLRSKDGKAMRPSDWVYSNVRTVRPVYTDTGQKVGTTKFSLTQHESSGTKKFLALAGYILQVLSTGAVLIIDELDARLHPNLVCRIVELFNSRKYNLSSAQLIINTHDTNLLSSGLLRRDQIWFTEKDRYGAATLYPLSDLSTRQSEQLEKNYIAGKYGAVPYLGNFHSLGNITSATHEDAE